MNLFEEQYRALRTQGAQAWAGEGYARAKKQQEQIFAWLQLNHYLPVPGASVLELGCGNGAMAAQSLAERGYSVWGVDFSETAIKWAEALFQQEKLSAQFLMGDVCHLSQLQNSMFELIIDGSCLHCQVNEARPGCFSEVRRLLTPTGRFVISSMCGSPRNPEDIARYDPENHHLLRNGQPWRTLKPFQVLLDEVQSAKFTVLATQVHKNPWWDHATIVCQPVCSPGTFPRYGI